MVSKLKMKTTKTLIVIAGLLICASGLARAETFLTAEELKETLVGKTLSGLTKKGIPFSQKILEGKPGKNKGLIEGTQEGNSYESKWKIKGNKWCENWGSGSGCWRIVRIDETTIQAYKGKKMLKHVWKLSPL